MNKVNLALQIIPLMHSEKIFAIVDKAIDCIKNSGVTYSVTPFETVMEGTLDELFEIVKGVHEVCYNAGTDELITNMKIHSSKRNDVFMAEKMAKY